MNCDLCHRPAVVHEVTVRNGVKREQHLCEQHASEAGIDVPGQTTPAAMTQFVICKGGGAATARAQRSCTSCGLTFRQFRAKGLLGCPECYESFSTQLSGMIVRAQSGGSGHVGKCPRRSGVAVDRTLRIQQICKELDDAVAAEQYERAAQLRDRLREIQVRSSALPGTQTPADSPGNAEI